MCDGSNVAKLIPQSLVTTQHIPIDGCGQKNIRIDVLRLDLIHPVVSGNKYFKLKYPVAKALAAAAPGIISFGGAWSNHLVALAKYCNDVGMRAIGIVRGEPGAQPSPTLQDAVGYGMTLNHIPRSLYNNKAALYNELKASYPGYVIVAEGGRSADGVSGAAEIAALTDYLSYDIIMGAVGTGTMLAGLLAASAAHQQVLGISSLKLKPGNDVEAFIGTSVPGKPFNINYDFHFGGYAKHNSELISFMNDCWTQYALPTDFVYTAKLMYAVKQLLAAGYFAAGSRILVIHSGGLQGNRSLTGKLLF
ncbi:MAG: pyridoxal-phosphate dependent enzyme [Chitinophagaceae bacterium]|nr:MAG: pyridoxal-phosphate dependent enzyme [Chitinophagaceae bacterium]